MIAKGTLSIFDIYNNGLLYSHHPIQYKKTLESMGLVMFSYFFHLWDKPSFETLLSIFLELAGQKARVIVMSKVCIAFWMHNFDCKFQIDDDSPGLHQVYSFSVL